MQIYLPFELENKLRVWAKENNRTVSSIVSEGIEILITGSPKKIADTAEVFEATTGLKPMCDRQFCKVRSEGKYKVVTMTGSREWSGNLCKFHWHQARKEGEVSAL